jgi:hypothetical protein
MKEESEGPKLIGQFEGTNVYYDKCYDENSVGITYTPINKDTNEGRLVTMPWVIAETAPAIVEGNLLGKHVSNRYILSADVATGEDKNVTVYAKPTGDPNKPYYCDNGEPWKPEKRSDYKAGFIITKIDNIDEFIEKHGTAVSKRIKEKLNLINGIAELPEES